MNTAIWLFAMTVFITVILTCESNRRRRKRLARRAERRRENRRKDYGKWPKARNGRGYYGKYK